MQEDDEKLNRIEEIKTKLNSRNYETKRELRSNFLHFAEKDVPDSWENEKKGTANLQEKFFKKTSMFKKFFIFSIAFFILAIGYASYMFFAGGNTVSNSNIEIAILGNTFTAGGEELPLQVEITNKNNSPLELADLLIEYPKSSSGDLSGEVERVRESLGTIPSGGVKTSNVKVILFGEQGSTRQIKVSLEYRVQNSNAIFLKDKLYDVSISSAPIDLSIEAPTEVTQNQDIVLNVKAVLNATKSASNILVKLDYPVGFQFESATPSPSLGNNVWSLGDLSPGTERDISIVGKMIDVSDGEEKTFHIFSGSQSDSDKSMIGIVFNSLGHTVAIKQPFIEAKLVVNGVYQREYAIDSSTTITGEINWANNFDTAVSDMEIRAKISGNAVNRKTIEVNQGYYNSSIDTIIWDKNNQNKFAEVNPGDSGSVNFSLSSLPLYTASSGMLSEPTIQIDVSISAKQPLLGDEVKSLDNSESKIIKIISNVGLNTKALYYSGPFTNTGSIPPKAEGETTYTIVWSLSNTSNNISGTQVRSTLPKWAKFIGTISPPTEDLSYNASTREILWSIGGVPRGTGITDTEREVSFQIGFTPSLSQVGSMPVIINDTTLTGHDDFANVDVKVNKSSLNTLLTSDPSFVPTGARVIE
ncbi:MAG TPA: hypothetical protein PKZ36_01560 [Candidatus Paceibacterota bacterium]|nr:hypothetical protein [Candidatus Paceibacterota bacterium]HPT18074.1 hypothetical protein [Candidatus Paceibacterota bacterium]